MIITGLQINTETADLLVHHRAAVVAEASGFIAETVLRAMPGDFKEMPLLGLTLPECLPQTATNSGREIRKRCYAPSVSMSQI